MRLLMLTRYDRLGASSRLRSLQYLPVMERAGWRVDVVPLFSNRYVEALYERRGKVTQTAAGFLRRFIWLWRAGRYDLLWIEKELFPFAPASAERLLRRLGVPYVVDYDDALFHRYDRHPRRAVRALLGGKIDCVMRCAEMVVAGNDYLAERARSSGARRVEILPTVIDLERYTVPGPREGGPVTIGWIGSPSTSRYLRTIAPALQGAVRGGKARFVALGASRDDLAGLDAELWRWSEETEVRSIQEFDIGIMPLPDEPWERGKCGYKLIQYMACGRPVIASPVGVNREIVEHGVNGYLAAGEAEWTEALGSLIDDAELRRRFGAEGRRKVEESYSLQVTGPRVMQLLNSLVQTRTTGIRS